MSHQYVYSWQSEGAEEQVWGLSERGTRVKDIILEEFFLLPTVVQIMTIRRPESLNFIITSFE